MHWTGKINNNSGFRPTALWSQSAKQLGSSFITCLFMMSTDISVTVIVNNVAHPPLVEEHGLALLIESNGQRILFDTGAGVALLPNLKTLGIAPATIDRIVLSHGHNDHTGGVHLLPERPLYFVPGIAKQRYSFRNGERHDLSMPSQGMARLNGQFARPIVMFTESLPNLFLTGPIPRISGEDCGGNFFQDENGTLPDTIHDEQALLLNTILFPGCCHAGIINTIEFCRKMLPKRKITTIIGGLHLRSASEERLRQTANYLCHRQIRKMYLLHCTGDIAITRLQQLMPECKIRTLRAGEKILLHSPFPQR